VVRFYFEMVDLADSVWSLQYAVIVVICTLPVYLLQLCHYTARRIREHLVGSQLQLALSINPIPSKEITTHSQAEAEIFVGGDDIVRQDWQNTEEYKLLDSC
jgi:hypothetical protein